MTMIYSATGTFPLKIRESISTKRSGLIEYSATYTIEKNSTPPGFAVGTNISTSEGSVSIFPGVSYSRSNDNPFDEMQVTAYGKGSLSQLLKVYGTEVLELSGSYQLTINTVTLNWTVYETWRCTTITQHSVLANTSTDYESPSDTLKKTMLNRQVIGSYPSGQVFDLNIVWNEEIRSISRTNFGKWDEVTVMKGYVPNVIK